MESSTYCNSCHFSPDTRDRKYTIDIEWAAKFILNMDIGKDAEPIIDRREPFGRSLPAIFSELEYEQTFLSDLD
jgi:hypothetical protein